jgi:hypothetical protein
MTSSLDSVGATMSGTAVEPCIVVEPVADPFSIGSGVALRKSRCPVFSISSRNRSS